MANRSRSPDTRAGETPSRGSGYGRVFLIALAVLAIDQVSKHWARNAFVEPLTLLPFLQLRYVTNTGAAFSIFARWPELLTWLIVIILGLLLFSMDWLIKESGCGVCIGLILGGAVGNLYDRFSLGKVTDFIDLSFWPTFNLADSALTIGVVIMVWRLYLKDRHERKIASV